MLRVESMKLPNEKVIQFTLAENEGLVLRGKNGSGKSLLLKALAQLCVAPYEVFEYLGQDVKSYHPETYRSEVLYVSTTPLLLKDQTIDEFFTSVKKLSVYKDHVSTFDYRPYLLKWTLGNEDVSRLSSGQKQMISVLRALTLKAKVLLLDEPTANLDQEKTQEIEKLIIDWKEQTRGSVVWISHSDDQTRRLPFKVINFEELVR